MTKKKRELIEILLDNVKPEDWTENLPYAAQDKDCCALWFYASYPKLADGFDDRFSAAQDCERFHYHPIELCKHWNKTIVHRDEFMKRWNERNPAVDSEGWIQWNGGEMPVEKGTLIDVKYRDGVVNLHVKAGERCRCGSIDTKCALRFSHLQNEGDIIAYRLHVPQQQKTPQQLAIEKFGTDWHDNEGVQPVDDNVLVDVVFCSETTILDCDPVSFRWVKDGKLGDIKKWRIHSDEKESSIDDAVKKLTRPESKTDPESERFKKIDEICMSVYGLKQEFLTDDPAVKSPLETKIGGIEKVISERGNNYGRFEDGAEIMQQLKLIAHTSQGWERMNPTQREGMDMILHKIGRILNGDPTYVDSWIDIEGYSRLVSDRLKGTSK